MTTLDGWKIQKCCSTFTLCWQTQTHPLTHANTATPMIEMLRWRKKIMQKWKSNQTTEMETAMRAYHANLPAAFNAFNYKWLGRWFSLHFPVRENHFCASFLIRVFAAHCLVHARKWRDFSISIKFINCRLIRLIFMDIVGSISRTHKRLQKYNRIQIFSFIFIFLIFASCRIPV